MLWMDETLRECAGCMGGFAADLLITDQHGDSWCDECADVAEPVVELVKVACAYCASVYLTNTTDDRYCSETCMMHATDNEAAASPR